MSSNRTEVGPHSRAMALPMREVVRELVQILGATTVATIGGVGETRAVSQWMDQREPQRPHVLRFAHQLAGLISGAANHEAARAWFHGSNPLLGDRSPVSLLANEPLATIQAPLLEAARAFARYRNN